MSRIGKLRCGLVAFVLLASVLAGVLCAELGSPNLPVTPSPAATESGVGARAVGTGSPSPTATFIPVRTPAPGILLMNGLNPERWASLPTTFSGKLAGVWYWRGWNEVYGHPTFAKIESAVAAADARGWQTSISIMLVSDVGKDGTPWQVYQSIGRTQGDPVQSNCLQSYTRPPWDDAGWRAAYDRMVYELAARYDGDPRIHSIMIATGYYGETVPNVTQGQCWYDIGGNGALTRFVYHVLEVYADAFKRTPLAILSTATTDRDKIALRATQLGIIVKHNSAAFDLPNHTFCKDDRGSLEVAGLVNQAGGRMAFEHFYAANAPQTYWTHRTMAAFKPAFWDLPHDNPSHLDALAAITLPSGERLWDWTVRYMDPNAGAYYLARNSQFPCDLKTCWECGWTGAITREMALSSGKLSLSARNGAVWKAAPKALTDALYGFYGIGQFSGALTFTTPYQAPTVRVWAIVAGQATLSYGQDTASTRNTGGWEYLEIETAYQGGVLGLSGTGHLHMIGMEGVASLVPTPTETFVPIPTATATPWPTKTPEPPATIAPSGGDYDRLNQQVEALARELLATQRQVLDLDRQVRQLQEWQTRMLDSFLKEQ